MSRPRLLDLFCNAGGATRGYQLAGFDVVGVDIEPQPDYCGDEFHQADALGFDLDGFDAIHASRPLVQERHRPRVRHRRTDRAHLAEAIPPAYTEHIGRQLLTALGGAA